MEKSIMDKFREFCEQFTSYLHSFLDSLKGKEGNDTNKLLIELGESDVEKTLIQKICTEIDIEHDLMEDAIKSQDIGRWFEEKMDDSIKAHYPQATSKEINDIKNLVKEGMEAEIDDSARQLENEMNDIESQTIAPHIVERKEGLR